MMKMCSTEAATTGWNDVHDGIDVPPRYSHKLVMIRNRFEKNWVSQLEMIILRLCCAWCLTASVDHG